ncbi:MAG: response regulator transcription factor [Anaerolineae bacterium]|nr:response regulator transcription factor [Anaerolineae bacterium]
MTSEARTLVVDDEASIRLFIEKALERTGHEVTTAANGEEALVILRNTPFDLVILDLRLGGKINGLKVLEGIRWRWPDTAVIILTAHGSLESAMTAIEGNVDRYLLKPLTPGELRQAVNEVLEERRQASQRFESGYRNHDILERGPFVIDLSKHTARLNDVMLDLTPSEFDLLVHLMRNTHRVVSPPELVEVVRDYRPEHLYEARNIIKWYIHRLRTKVEHDTSHPRYILNVRGVGYRFGG